MHRILKSTEDGSNTLYVTDLDETYHSTHGALQEAKHVFIKNGIKRVNNYEINILELGFGTGLNAMVTLNHLLNEGNNRRINYYSIEKYPLSPEEISALHYEQLFDKKLSTLLSKINEVAWVNLTPITPQFYLKKINADFFELRNLELPPINLVYFDCFGARVQPDLWEKPLIEMVASKMNTGGLFTTYSAKGSLQRILKSLNFSLEKLEGPKGKREMINAWKK